MAEQITLDEFNRLTRKHFRYLEDEYGFLFRNIKDWSFVAETPVARIHIYLEHYAMLVVEIEPVGEQANQLLKQNLFPLRTGIISISKYYCPDFQYELAILDEKNHIQNIPVEIEQRATLLRTCLTKMLNGDFSDWPKTGQYLSYSG